MRQRTCFLMRNWFDKVRDSNIELIYQSIPIFNAITKKKICEYRNYIKYE